MAGAAILASIALASGAAFCFSSWPIWVLAVALPAERRPASSFYCWDPEGWRKDGGMSA
jgi:hypothetical protein